MRRASTAQHAPEPTQIDAIVDAMSNVELTEYDAWNDLDVLSSQTYVEGINVDPAGIIVSGDKFIGLATVYVALRYGPDGDDEFETSYEFEGKFDGHFEGTRPVIENVTVDTTPFYE